MAQLKKGNVRSWLCRLAERVEFAGDFSGRPGARKASRGLWLRLVDRHVERCPSCRSERAANERLARLIKELDRPPAPPDLLPAVMAKIAAERAGAPGGAGGETRPGRRLRRALFPAGRREPGAAFVIAAAAGGWVGFVSAPGWSGGSPHGVLGAVQAAAVSAAAYVRAHAIEAAYLLRAGFAAVPPELQSVLAAVVWSAVGLGAALLAPLVVSVQSRPR